MGAAAKLHDAGINHTQVCEHKIVYNTDNGTCWQLVGFTTPGVEHHCSPNGLEPRQVASSKEMWGDMDVVSQAFPQ